MESYYGINSINVDGEIGAVMYELLAGVETEIPLPSMLSDSAFNDGVDRLAIKMRAAKTPDLMVNDSIN